MASTAAPFTRKSSATAASTVVAHGVVIDAGGAFDTMGNEGEAVQINPDSILNASLNVSHTCLQSERWLLIVSVGADAYSAPSEIVIQQMRVLENEEGKKLLK